MSLVKLDELNEQDAFQEQQVLQQAQEIDEEENFMANVTADDVIEMVAEIVASFKCKTLRGREMFIERFKASVKFPLTIIGFNKALRQIPLMKLPPHYTVALGIAIMIVFAIIIKVDEQEEKQERPQQQETPLKKLAVENVQQGMPPEAEEYMKLAQSYLSGKEGTE